MVVTESVLYAIESQNLVLIKSCVLGILFLYSVFAYLFHDRIDKDKSYMFFWFYYIAKVFSIMYIIMSPMLLLFLLNTNITLEIFVLIIISMYLLFSALFIGMSIYHGSSEIFRIFGYDDWNEFVDERKRRKSMKKYG